MVEAVLVQESIPEPQAIPNSTKVGSRSGSPLVWAAVAVLVGFFLLSACGSGSLREAERSSAQASIYAAVARQLVEFDNTFGPDHRFREILIVDQLDPDAGDAVREDQSGRQLSEDQRSEILAAIEHLAPVSFIKSQRQFIRGDDLAPVIPRSVIITLAPVEFDDDGAIVGANLWCGGTCGLWVTYRVTEGPDGWTVAGREGTWSIS